MSINKFGFRTNYGNDIDLDRQISSELDKFVKSTGGSMVGALNMNNNRIMNLANPSEQLDAATKKYVDRLDTKIRVIKEEQNKYDKSLDDFKKDIKISNDLFRKEISKLQTFDYTDMKNKQIKNVADPIDPNDVVTKSYFEKKNTFIPKEYKLKIPTYHDKTINGELKLISTQIDNLFILIGKLTILANVTTKTLNIAEMTQHFTDYQYVFKCVRYEECDIKTVNQLIKETLVDILIRDNNLFLLSGIDQIKKRNCLEINTSVYLNKSS